MKLFPFEYDMNWPKSSNRLTSPLKLFSKMYFLFYPVAFGDVMKFENLKF